MPTPSAIALHRTQLIARLEALARRNDTDVFYPGQPIAILYRKDGATYAVSGYHIFDETQEVRTRSGMAAPKLKKLRPDHVWVRGDNDNSPIQRHIRDLTPIKAGKHYLTFQEVFGPGVAGGITVDAVVETEKEDLTLGVDFVEQEDE